MAVAAMQSADQHIRSSFGVQYFEQYFQYSLWHVDQRNQSLFFICGCAETYFASIYSGGWIKLKQSANIPQMNPAGTARSSQACACDVGVL